METEWAKGPAILSGLLMSHVFDFPAPGLDVHSLRLPQLSLWRTFRGGNWEPLLQATGGLIPVGPPRTGIEVAGLALPFEPSQHLSSLVLSG